MERQDQVVKEMIDVVEEMVDTKTAEIAEEIDSAEAITVEAVMKTVWTEIGNVQNVTITTSQEETSVTDVVYLVPAAVEEILVEAVAEATEAVVMEEEIPAEVVAEATEAVVMAEEILDAAVVEATEAVVMAEEILVEAVAEATEAVAMVVETQVAITIDVREEMILLEENQKVPNLDMLKERNQDMPITVDLVISDHKGTIETVIEVIKWVQNTIT